jgi:hypothetical protein
VNRYLVLVGRQGNAAPQPRWDDIIMKTLYLGGEGESARRG